MRFSHIFYQSDDLEVRLTRPEAGNALIRLVTFESIAGAREATPRKPFGAPLADKWGIGVLHVIPRASTWYQEPDISDCLTAVTAAIDSSVVAYGSSMGGYAVAHFADLIGVETGICLSPQVSIQTYLVPYETRWREPARTIHFRRTDTLRQRRARLWVFVDPEHEQDRLHAEAIAEAGPTEIIPVPFAGHPVGPALVEGGNLSAIVRLIVDGRADKRTVLDLVATGADQSPTRLVNLARTLRGAEREATLRQACAIAPQHTKAAFNLGLDLLRQRRVEEATEFLKVAIRPPFRNGRRVDLYRQMCARLGIPPVLLDDAALPPRGARPRDDLDRARL